MFRSAAGKHDDRTSKNQRQRQLWFSLFLIPLPTISFGEGETEEKKKKKKKGKATPLLNRSLPCYKTSPAFRLDEPSCDLEIYVTYSISNVCFVSVYSHCELDYLKILYNYIILILIPSKILQLNCNKYEL